MEIRTLASSDFEAFLELEGYAFHAVVDERRLEKARKVWAHAVGLGAFSEEGALQSALLIRPHKVFLYGKSIGMGGIGDVASYPEARGQGNVRALMKESFRYMKDQQMLVSYLSPFSQSFYRKFGYELTFEERTYKISPSDFQALDTGDRTVRRVRWEDEKETLKRLYTQKYQQRIGPVNREDWAWEEKKRWHDDLHVALCVDEKGKAEGYAIYRFQSTRPYVFVVNELVALSGQAERALWQFIASHGPQFDHFKYKTGISNRLTHLFPEMEVEQKLVPGMMARIVDMEAFLNAYPFKFAGKQAFELSVVDDESAEWNNGTYRLEMSETKRTISKTDSQTTTPRLEADIQTWTQLLMGTRTAQELQFQGRLRTDTQTAEDFQELLHDTAPELYDFF